MLQKELKVERVIVFLADKPKNGGVTHNFESGPPKDQFNSNF
jgi:hypothetical protein